MKQIVKHTATLASQAKTWANLNDEDLRRRAMLAANERNFDELLSLTEAYLYAHGKKGGKLSDGTRAQYKRGLKDLLDHWQGENLLRPTRNAGFMYIRSLEEFLSPSTVQGKLAAARNLYKALRWAAATESTPFENSSPVADPTPAWEKRKHYSQEELTTLFDEADQIESIIILLGSHAGLRVSEMASLKWTDIKGEYLTVIGKGRKKRTIGLSNKLIEALEQPKLNPNKKRPGFVLPFGRKSIWLRIKNLAIKTNIDFKGRSIHGLRHSAGTRFYLETKDIASTADHLGHSNINTTRGYAKRDNEATRQVVKDW